MSKFFGCLAVLTGVFITPMPVLLTVIGITLMSLGLGLIDE